jgi:hypothetical protein
MGKFRVKAEQHRAQHTLPEQIEERSHRSAIVAIRPARGKSASIEYDPQRNSIMPRSMQFWTSLASWS